MNHTQDTYGILYKTMKWLSNNRRFHLSIHDTSGLIHNMSEFSLPISFLVHNDNFCSIAKSTPAGMRSCIKCKAHVIRKAVSKPDIFIGKCYLGITEIIRAVVFNGRPVCVIHLGNLLIEEEKTKIRERIKRASKVTGADCRLLLEALDTTEAVNTKLLDELKEIVEILHNLIILTLKDMKKQNIPSRISPVYAESKNWVVQSVQNYVYTFYNRELKLFHLARLFFINPQYLCRIFKKETGSNFSDYVNLVRINKAKELLNNTESIISEIALSTGFANVTYFNRVFRKITGMSPGEYRKGNAPA